MTLVNGLVAFSYKNADARQRKPGVKLFHQARSKDGIANKSGLNN